MQLALVLSDFARDLHPSACPGVGFGRSQAFLGCYIDDNTTLRATDDGCMGLTFPYLELLIQVRPHVPK